MWTFECTFVYHYNSIIQCNRLSYHAHHRKRKRYQYTPEYGCRQQADQENLPARRLDDISYRRCTRPGPGIYCLLAAANSRYRKAAGRDTHNGCLPGSHESYRLSNRSGHGTCNRIRGCMVPCKLYVKEIP